MAKLTEGQLQAISIMERTCSVVSILGCLFTIVTFTCFRAFQEKPINRLVFYASFGNLMSCVGTLMSRSFLDHPNSFGCQLQALLIQWYAAFDQSLSVKSSRSFIGIDSDINPGSWQPTPAGYWRWQ